MVDSGSKDKAHWMRLECGFCFKQYTPDMIDGIIVIMCPNKTCGHTDKQTTLQL
jgi:hypothetical protein